MMRGLHHVLAVWLAFAPHTAFAQDFVIDGHLIDRCLGINDHTPMACVGRQSDICYDNYGGGANMILATCQEAELAYWDGVLNAAYQSLLALVATEQESDVGYTLNQLTDATRAMQRSWIGYRDATCGLAVAHAMPFGSAAGPASTHCNMRETARQYFQLQQIAGSFRR